MLRAGGGNMWPRQPFGGWLSIVPKAEDTKKLLSQEAAEGEKLREGLKRGRWGKEK